MMSYTTRVRLADFFAELLEQAEFGEAVYVAARRPIRLNDGDLIFSLRPAVRRAKQRYPNCGIDEDVVAEFLRDIGVKEYRASGTRLKRLDAEAQLRLVERQNA